MNTPPFRIVPLAPELVKEIRRTRTDPLGSPVQVRRLASRVPCRFTLQLTEPGEELILTSYSPFRTTQPYRETGPVFIRLEGNEPYRELHRFPPQIDPVNRVFRAYDKHEEIVDARIGTPEPEKLIDELFANANVESIHVRSLTYGCFTFKIERG